MRDVEPRQADFQHFVAAELGVFQAELGELDRVALPLEDDFFGFLREVVGLVHLFELVELVLFVVEHEVVVLDHELGRLDGHRPVDFVVALEIFLGFAVGSLGQHRNPA